MKSKLKVTSFLLVIALGACAAPNANQFITQNPLIAPTDPNAPIIAGLDGERHLILQAPRAADPSAPQAGTSRDLNTGAIIPYAGNSGAASGTSSAIAPYASNSAQTVGDTQIIEIEPALGPIGGAYNVTNWQCGTSSSTRQVKLFFGSKHVTFIFDYGSAVEFHIVQATYSNPSSNSGSITTGTAVKKFAFNKNGKQLNTPTYSYGNSQTIYYSITGNAVTLQISGDPVCSVSQPGPSTSTAIVPYTGSSLSVVTATKY